MMAPEGEPVKIHMLVIAFTTRFLGVLVLL